MVLTSRGRFAITGSLDGMAQVWDLSAQDVDGKDVHDGKVRGVVSRAALDSARGAALGGGPCRQRGACVSCRAAGGAAAPAQPN